MLNTGRAMCAWRLRLLSLLSVFVVCNVAALPLPSISGAIPSAPLIGETFCFDTEFTNTGGTDPNTDVGFGPYYQLLLEPGVTLTSTSFFNSSIDTLVGTFSSADGNELTDPLSETVVTGTEGGTLHILEIPVGSVSQGQPPLEANICLSVGDSSLENIDPANHPIVSVPLSDAVSLTPGFKFGNQPTGSDAIVANTSLTQTLTPSVLALSTQDNQPEGEVPPGESYAWTVMLEANVAANKTVVPSPPSSTVDFPVYNIPYNVEIVDTGAPGPDITLPSGCTANYVAPNFASQVDGSLTISCSTLEGDASPLVTDDEEIVFQVYKVDTLDPMSCSSDPNGMPINAAKHVSLLKSVSNESIPGSTVTYTLNIRLSEFLTPANGSAGVDALTVADVIPDGMTFDTAFAPEIDFNGAGFIDMSAGFSDAGELADGTRNLSFDVIAANGGATIPAQSTVNVRYQAIIDQNYSSVVGPVLGRDTLTNSAIATYDIEGVGNANGCSDDSSATTTISDVEVEKAIFSVNGVPVGAGSADVEPGDDVVFRMRIEIPSGDLDGVIFRDYFPLPIFDATDIDTNTDISANTDISFSGNSTLTSDPASIVVDGATNALIIDWGDLSSAGSEVLEIDVAVKTTTEPYNNNLDLVNFLQAETNNTAVDASQQNAIVEFSASSPTIEITKTIESTSADPAAPDVGDLVNYEIELLETASVDAFNVTVTDTTPTGLTGCTLAPSSAALGSGDIFGAGFSLSQGAASPALAASGSVVLEIECTVDTAAAIELGQTITNEASVVWNGDFAESELFPAELSEVDLVIRQPQAFKSIVSTSEPHTSDATGDTNTNGDRRPLAIGEIARFRIWAELPEGIADTFEMRDLMPSGMQYINDGTTQIAFVSSSGAAITSSLGAGAICSGGTLSRIGNETTLATIVPDCTLSPALITGGAGSGGAFESGNDPRFSLGDVTNSESTSDQEFIVIELNAVLLDDAANTSTLALSNLSQARVSAPNPDGPGRTTRSDNSGAVWMEVARPILTVAKNVDTPAADLNDLLTFTLTVSHASGAANAAENSSSDAFEITLDDIIPAGYSYTTSSLTSPAAASGETCVISGVNVDDSDPDASVSGSPEGLTVTFDRLVLGDVCEMQFTATAVGSIAIGTETINTANVTWSSLPGSGTLNGAGNPTGSDITTFPALAENSSTTSGSSQTLTDPEIGVAKNLTSLSNNGDGTSTATFSILAVNSGNLAIENFQLTDDLATTFAGANGFAITSGPSSGSLSVNTSFDGDTDGGANPTDINLLVGTDTLDPGDSVSIDFSVQFDPGSLMSFANSVAGTGQTPGGLNVSDVSTDGTLTDPDEDGDPSNNSVPTSINIGENPALGMAKMASPAIDVGGGLYETTFTLNVANIGNTTLANVQVIDDLANTFSGAASFTVVSSPVISGISTLDLNSGFNGDSDVALLNAATSFLAAGAKATISFTVRFDPVGGTLPFNNSATVEGYLPGTDAASNPPDANDLSDNGTAVDEDGDGNADELGENDPTPITTAATPIVGLAKRASPTISVGGGEYETTITLVAENLGNADLTDLQVSDDLTNTFTGAASVVSISGISVVAEGASALTLGSYDGVTDFDLLGGNDTLLIGDRATIQFTVRFNPGTETGPFNNSATATSTAGGGTSDISDDGAQSDADGDLNPDEAGENDATPISFGEDPIIAVAKSATPAQFIGGTGYRSTFSIRLENLGNVLLDNVQVTESLISAFPAPASFTIVSGPSLSIAPASGAITFNGGFDGSNETALLDASASNLPVGEFAVFELVVDFDSMGSAGPFFNQVLASAKSPLGRDTTDLSDEGSDPDANGDNDPGSEGESDPTLVSLNEQPILGVAKQAGVVSDNGDGTFTVPFTITVENFGNVDLNALQISENLSDTFAGDSFLVASAPVSGSLSPNSVFDGDSDGGANPSHINLLDGTDSLAPGAKASVEFSVRFTPASATASYSNQVSASAQSPSLILVNDLSQNGAEADPDGDNIPTNNDSATPFSVARIGVIGVAKSASPAVAIGGGLFESTMTITLENLGSEPLFYVGLEDDLATVFSGANSFSVISAPIVTGLSGITANSAYDGSSDQRLILPAQSTLAAGDLGSIEFTLQFDPTGGSDPFNNSVSASAYLAGIDPNTNPPSTTDLSDNGVEADSDQDGIPDESGENDPTPITTASLARLGLAKSASPTVELIVDQRYSTTITLTLENLGNTDLTAVQIIDDLNPVFFGEASVISVTTPAVSVQGSSALAANAGFDGLTDFNLLSGADTLLVGDSATLSFDLVFEPGSEVGPFENSAVATSTAGGGISDISDNGTDVDANGNGIADETDENDSTPIGFGDRPVIGAAKRATDVQYLSGNVYSTTFTIRLENLGNVPLSDVQIVESLSSAFPDPASFAVVSGPSISVPPASGTLVVNGGFNGTSDSQLLDAAASDLPVGEFAEIELTVEFDPQGSAGPFSNQALVSAQGPNGQSTTDLSDDGAQVDGNGNGDPSESDENDATPIEILENPLLGVAKVVGSVTPTGVGDQVSVPFTIFVENLGDVELRNLQLTENLSTTFGTDPFAISSAPVSATLTSNGSFDGISGGDINLLAGTDTLAIGATESIEFTVVFTPAGPTSTYSNQVAGTANSPNAVPVLDLSQSGNDPDPNNDGDARDNNAPTNFAVTPAAVIGIAKVASIPVSVSATEYVTTISLRVENLGSASLLNVLVKDDLASSFAGATSYSVTTPPTVSGSNTLYPNTDFNGDSDTDLLMVGATANAGPSVMAPGEIATISFDVTFDPTGGTQPFNNVATAQGYLQGSNPVTDLPDSTDTSNNGEDPDPDGDGNPNEAGENAPTPITTLDAPVIGLAKSASPALEVIAGTRYQSTITLTLENLGNTDLLNTQVVDDLSSILLGSATLISVSTPVVTVDGSSSLTANSGYDGDIDTNLLAAGGTLLFGDRATVVFDMQFEPNAEPGPFNNSAIASSSSGGGISDISTDGSNPDPDGDGDPTEAEENESTPIVFGETPLIGVAKAVTQPQSLGMGSFGSTVEIVIENLGNTPLDNLQIIEDLETTFPAPVTFAVVSAPSVIEAPSTGTVTINSAFISGTDVNLLDAANSNLAIGERATIAFDIEFNTQGNGGPFFNQVTASGDSPNGATATDLSDNGTEPDENGNGDPTDLGEDDATPMQVVLEANLSGTIWLDENFDGALDAGEERVSSWLVDLYDPLGNIVDTATTNINGEYSFADLPSGNGYRVRLRHPESNVVWGELDNLQLNPGENLLDQNLPIDPAGVFYNSISREPIAGVEVSIVNGSSGIPLPVACLLDPSQQSQTTASDGRYRFDIIAGADPACPSATTEYALIIDQPSEYNAPPSSILGGPVSSALDANVCAADAVPATPVCEVQAQSGAPQTSDPVTDYYFNFLIGNGSADVVNNHIPLDFLDGAVSLVKLANPKQVNLGGFASYTLRASNNLPGELAALDIVDDIPAGFSLVAESVQLIRTGPDTVFGSSDDVKESVTVIGSDPLTFPSITLAANEEIRLSYLLRVGVGVATGDYINTAQVQINGIGISNVAEATVEVTADPLVGKTTIIGKVFHDRDGDGWQDNSDASNIDIRGGYSADAYIPQSTEIDYGDGNGFVGISDTQGLLHTGLSFDKLAARKNDAAPVDIIAIKQRLRGSRAALLNDLELTSEEGTTLTYSTDGTSRTHFSGDLETGKNNQQLRITTDLSRASKKIESVESEVTRYEEVAKADLIEPIRFSSGQSNIDDHYVQRLSRLLTKYKDKRNVRINFIGHTDNERLSQRAASIYRDNHGLSLSRAKRVADHVRATLGLDQSSVSYDGQGATQPVATNATAQGMALNRRVEIEIVYEEPVTRQQVRTRLDPSADEWIYTVYIENHGVQEEGLPGVRLATATGLLIETDAFGRYHVADIELANLDLGHNVILKVDTATLPEGTVFTTENPRVQRLTSSLMNRFNFGVRLPEPRRYGIKNCQNHRSADCGVVGSTMRHPSIHDDTQAGELSYSESVQGVPIADGQLQAASGIVWVTEDPAVNDPRLDVRAMTVARADEDGLTEPVEFQIYTNYQAFIDQWKLMIYRDSDRDLVEPLFVLQGDAEYISTPVQWHGLGNGEELGTREKLVYQLRVYDKDGLFDETAPRLLQVEPALAHSESLSGTEKPAADGKQVERQNIGVVYGSDNLQVQNIPIRGSRVRVAGEEIAEGYSVLVNNQEVPVDSDGRFVHEEHLPLGKQNLSVVTRYGDEKFERSYDVNVDGDHIFMVGLANVTLGENSVNGNVEQLSGDERFNGDTFTDGRLAFYLKGKIKGKYLVTAQMDSTYDDLDNFSDNLKRKDPTKLFRRLDPEAFYPVYGDDSKTVSDVDSQGALYVRVDWDKSRGLWGNYNTGLTANEFAYYNRSLYGAQLVYNTNAITTHGDDRFHAEAFASEPESAAGHNRFRATGGSLYYLQQKDIVQGSEKLWVETVKRDTLQVQETRTLVRGRDYEIDYIQGRVILMQPLLSIAYSDTDNIIRDEPLDGDEVFLQADFEYVPVGFEGEDLTAGGRLHAWVNDAIGIGLTAVDESRKSGEDYRLAGADLTLRAGKGTYIKLEGAESESNQSRAAFSSDDGGLTFARDSIVAGGSSRANAVGIEAQMNFSEVTETKNGFAKLWFKERESGFSASRTETTLTDTSDLGLEVAIDVGKRGKLSLRGNRLEQENLRENITASIQGEFSLTDKLSTGLELSYDESDETMAGGLLRDATLAGLRLKYKASDQTELWAEGQHAIDAGDAYLDNDAISLGVRSRFNSRFSLGAEATSGDRGDALLLQTEFVAAKNMTMQLEGGIGSNAHSQIAANYALDNGHELYGSYAVDPDTTEGEKSTTTLGSRKEFGNGVDLFVESQFAHDDEQAGLGHVFGLDFGIGSHWHWSASIQKSDIEVSDGSQIDRDVLSLGAQFKRNNLRFGGKIEYRVDDADTDKISQWLSSNSIEYKASDSWRWLSKLNYSLTESDTQRFDDAMFSEFDLGVAFRPVRHDRLNLLGKYSYLYDLGSAAQFNGSLDDPLLLGPDSDERAHIISVEALYDVSKRWELGSKIALRRGALRIDRAEGPWFDHGVDLAVVRGRYHFIKRLDGVIEYRWLSDSELDDSKAGVLTGLYFHVGNHFKLGGGYNFTDYSNDLKDLEYDSKGWFIDLVGKL